MAEDGSVIVGGRRYVVGQLGKAEVAFMVVEQGRGVGASVMKHLATIARSASIRELIAEVLPENGPMLKVFKKCGFAVETIG